LRDPIVREHGNFINVVKFSVGLAIKTSPQISYKNLRAFEEANGLLPVLEGMLVTETVEILCEDVDETCSRAICFFNKVDN
jgi:hypothetical protein